MRKIIALLMLVVFIAAGCSSATVEVKAPTDQRSIQRSREAHGDLERKIMD
ncbi:MAG: hypothetical protein LBH05_01105 [Deferribacteraceae bacterium]|jgi:PBP1b-binding outer membrane lipoprotein LpoB|nr:hypothetical protein [Deferribacteraceae bacterium]